MSGTHLSDTTGMPEAPMTVATSPATVPLPAPATTEVTAGGTDTLVRAPIGWSPEPLQAGDLPPPSQRPPPRPRAG
jgi:hypothetical protein